MLALRKVSVRQSNFAYHTSVTAHGNSRWKWAHRPDLRDFTGDKLKELKEAAKTDEEARMALYEMDLENKEWIDKADQEEIAQRLYRMLKNSSYNLVNGGFRKGIFQIYLKTLETPQQLNIVIQCLNVWQQKQFKRTEDQVNSIPANISSLVCKAAARVGAPDLGLSYIQMPWVNTTHSRNNLNVLLSRYAVESEAWILYKKAAGEPITAPPNYKEIRAMSKGKKTEGTEDEEDEESEEEETEEVKAKKLKSFFDHWINSFMQTYREARSDKYSWTANSETYSFVARFYAALGDCDASLQILETFPDISPKAIDTIILGLLSKNRAEEANKIVNTHYSGNASRHDGPFATSLALNNREESVTRAKSLLDNHKSLAVTHPKSLKYRPTFCKFHFGVPERIALLQSIANQELKGLISNEDFSYIMSLEGPAKEETEEQEKEEGEEGEEGEEKEEKTVSNNE